MLSIYRKSIIIFFAAVLVRLAYHWVTGFTADDAFITFRYAENIAYGKGFVYNTGERVLGTTTPLFTLLLSLFAVLRVIPLHASLFISLVSSGLTAVIIYRFALILRFTQFAHIPVILYLLWPRSLTADICGMETAFFTLLVTAAFYFQRKRLYFYAIGMATLATVTRPEGLIVLGILVVHNCIKDRHNWISYVVMPMLLIVPWLVFARLYFGSFIPHSITAKLALYGRFGSLEYLDNLWYLMGWHHPVGWIFSLAFIAGAYWLNRKQNMGWLEILWICALITFLTFSRTHLFFWYMVPMYPLYLLFASASLPLLVERFSRRGGRVSVVPMLSGAILIILLIVAVIPQAKYYRDFQNQMENIHKKLGLYLYAHADREKDSAALEDIGYSGYFSTLRVIDRDGLVSPQVVPYNRAGDYMGAVLSSKPMWVGAAIGSPLSEFITDSAFFEAYHQVECFTYGDHPGYCLYKRNMVPSP